MNDTLKNKSDATEKEPICEKCGRKLVQEEIVNIGHSGFEFKLVDLCPDCDLPPSKNEPDFCEKCGREMKSILVCKGIRFDDGSLGRLMTSENLCPRCDEPKRILLTIMIFLTSSGIVVLSGYIIYLLFR